MYRVETPIRPEDEQSRASAAHIANTGYWWEGIGYEITQGQADELRTSVTEMIARYNDAMDRVVADPKLLRRFYFVDDVDHNRAIQDLAAESWKNPLERSYIMDRWDIAYDGVNPPKLLERNFGYLGLVESTGVLQEEYIDWLKRQPGYTDATSFGDLRTHFIEAFREVATDRRIPESADVALIVEREQSSSDKGMIYTSDVLDTWIQAAGYKTAKHYGVYAPVEALGLLMTKQEIYRTVQSLYDYLKAKGEKVEGVNFRVNFAIEDSSVRVFCTTSPGTDQILKNTKKKLSKTEHGAGIRFLVTEKSWEDLRQQYKQLKADPSSTPVQSVYPFVSFDSYVKDFAKLRMRDDILSESFSVMQPAWVQLMGHKSMQPVLHEMFPQHPNFLKTIRGVKGIAGEKSFAKHVDSCQGQGARVIAADGKVTKKRSPSDGESKKYYSNRNYISQEYCDAVRNPDGSHKVMHMFTTNGRPAAIGTREGPLPFVGGANTKTRFVPVIVRDQTSPERTKYSYSPLFQDDGDPSDLSRGFEITRPMPLWFKREADVSLDP